MLAEREKPLIAFGALAIALGGITVSVDSLNWYSSQASVSLYDQASQTGLVLRFFLAEAIAILLIVVGVYVVYRALIGLRLTSTTNSIGSVISDAIASARDRRIGVLAAVVYAVIYAVVSSNLVYQPGVDFLSVYGVSATSLNTVACCGSPGTVPAIVVYLLPQAHLALQVLPLGALFQVVFPILVGFNVTVVSYSLRGRQTTVTGGWISTMAVTAGLFTGCPTCAGLFLASALGGATASTLALALAPLQAFFIAVSIPVLLLSPILVAASIKRSMYAACRLPLEARGRPLGSQ